MCLYRILFFFTSYLALLLLRFHIRICSMCFRSVLVGQWVGRSFVLSIDLYISAKHSVWLYINSFAYTMYHKQSVCIILIAKLIKTQFRLFWWLNILTWYGSYSCFFSPDKLYCTFHISFYISFWLCVFCAVSSFLPYRIIHHTVFLLFFFWVPLVGISSTAFCACCYFFPDLLFRAPIIAKRLWLWCLIITIYMFMKRSLRFKLHWARSTNFALKRASILCRLMY